VLTVVVRVVLPAALNVYSLVFGLVIVLEDATGEAVVFVSGVALLD
jgi:hypothetical protein